ncbi:MAG TPA: carboxypeptidase-like regulatory domain-containing protein, partial [Acidobacteriaceae bacterium]|nr:carboxypeptidase-like regulatory domain-containing protein [Acidobacteriaceae bacterium]
MGVARWMGWAVFAAVANAQQARVCVVDATGHPLQGATVTVRVQTAQSGSPAAMDANACVNVPPGSVVIVTMKGFARVTAAGPVAGATERVVLRPVAAQESVTVTADRGLAGINDAASSVAVLTAEKLKAAPGLTLDDRLHQIAGFQLFRRTSSWTANPTSSGVSLRALGSTAASRTLVV